MHTPPGAPGHWVYLIVSESHPAQTYVGQTTDLDARLAAHNAGQSLHTSRHRPWTIHTAVWFRDQALAWAFERYLKSGSGRAFARRHFGV